MSSFSFFDLLFSQLAIFLAIKWLTNIFKSRTTRHSSKGYTISDYIPEKTIISSTSQERWDLNYRFGSFIFLPSKNSPNIRSRSSAVYLTYFWGFFPFSTRGLQQNNENKSSNRWSYRFRETKVKTSCHFQLILVSSTKLMQVWENYLHFDAIWNARKSITITYGNRNKKIDTILQLLENDTICKNKTPNIMLKCYKSLQHYPIVINFLRFLPK